jgi:tetratricopeptide (TPR) repeat protein
MVCARCGGTHVSPEGRCTACGAQTVVGPVEVASAVLTPPPDSSEPTYRLTPDEAATRLGMTAGAGMYSDSSAPGGPAGAGTLVVGSNFGTRYHIIRRLGAGGMGAVYQAWDRELEVTVALKVIHPWAASNPDAAKDLERRFKRELLLARQITHRNVVRIHDLGEVDGIKYITMPYLEGADLSHVLRGGPLPVTRVVLIARQVAAGLVAAHEAGVVHRDLKPSNIMVDAEDHACIMDFGIARSLSASTVTGLTREGAVVGTVEYMAPEQALGRELDHRADIYAFGLIVYDMLSQRRQASQESSIADLVARLHKAPPPLRQEHPELPEALEAIVSRCLEPDPSARFQTTRELAIALDSLDADGQARPGTVGLPVRPAVSDAPPAEPRTLTRRVRRALWAVPAILLVLGAGVYFLFQQQRQRPPDADGSTGTSGSAPASAVSLAVVPFRNATGDPSLDWLGPNLAELLQRDIGQSAALRLVPSGRLQQTIRDLKLPPDQAIDPAALVRLADFVSADTIVWGQYVKLGSEIRIDATVQDVKRQRSVPVKVQASSDADLLGAIETLARSVRENLAVSPEASKALASHVLKPSSRSMAALRYYNEGLSLAREGRSQEAIEKFRSSTGEDPQFALAFSKLGLTYAALGYDTEAERASRSAVALSDSLPEPEKYLVRATHARIMNDYPQAIDLYSTLMKSAPENEEVLFDLAQLYETTGEYDKAGEFYARLVAQDANYVDALLALGRVEIRRGNPQGGLESLARAQSLAIRLDNPQQRAAIAHAMGVAYKVMNKPEEALRQYQEALDIRTRLGEKRGIAVSLNEMAQVLESLGRADEARASYQKALGVRRDIGDRRGIGDTLIDLGNFLSDRGQYDEALRLFKESLQIQHEVGEPAGEALCLHNIGNVYLSKGQFDDALTYFERALQLRETLKVPGDIADTVHNLAETSSRLGQFDQALQRYLRALELRRGTDDRRGAAIESNGLAQVFEYQGRYGAALAAQKEALDALRQLGEQGFWLVEVQGAYGRTLAEAGRIAEARPMLDEALTKARALGNQTEIAQVLNALGDWHLYQGNARDAAKLYDEALEAASAADDRIQILLARANAARAMVRSGRGGVATRALRQLAQEADRLGLKYLAVACSVDLAEALLAVKQQAAARQELDRAMGKSEKLGLQMLLARAHYLSASGAAPADARRHLEEAQRIVDRLRREPQAEKLADRADIRPFYQPHPQGNR